MSIIIKSEYIVINTLGERIRVGLVGCGRISTKHFEAISKHDKLELVAVCDNDNVALNKAVETYNVIGYKDYSLLLKDASIDVVVLCTPSGLHSSQTIEASCVGKHVITEKPMATHWQDGIDMVNSCHENNVNLFVVKQNRYNKTLQLLKRVIKEGRFGKIFMVNINVFWTRPQKYYDSSDWRGTWELDGGAIMNQASHYVDLLDWLIGPVAEVHAMTDTLARNIEVEDTGILNIRWKSGTLGSMSVTMLTYPKNMEGSITIIGERGTVKVGGVAVNEIQHWDFEDKCDYDKYAQDSNYQTDSVYGFGHSRYYRNIVDVFDGNVKPDTDGKEGLRSLEILIATYLSAKNGNIVYLPLKI